MHLISRFSFIATVVACLLLFGTASAPAATGGEIVGTLKIEGKKTVQREHGSEAKQVGNLSEVMCGDVIETGIDSVIVSLTAGQDYLIHAHTRVKFTCNKKDHKVALLVISGGVNPVGSEAGYVEHAAYLAAFGDANFPVGAATGGNNGYRVISTVNPQGQVIYTTVAN